MKHIKILLLSLASSFGAMAADFTVSSGQLEGLLSDESLKNQTELKLKGRIDARDLAAFEKLPAAIKTLDLRDVSIEALTMPERKYFGRTLFGEGEIPAYTFFKTGVNSIVLPAGVNVICEGAFAGSDIENIEIPEGVTSLGDYAFYGCANLKSVKLPSTLVSIGKGTFGNCVDLQSIDLSGTKLTEIPASAFAGSLSLKEISLPQNIVKVGREAFSYTSIGNLSLPGVKEFEGYALSGMPFLTSLTINPDAKIGDGLLMDNTSLDSLTGVPSEIPAYFAANCGNLNAKELSSDAIAIGKYSFANTMAPETLFLTSGLERIDRGALSGLNNIKTIDVTELGGNIPSVDDTTFEGLDQSAIDLYVDHPYFDSWAADPVWSLFNLKSNDPTSVDTIAGTDGESISISCRQGFIVIESAAAVSDVRIYTPDGRMAFVASPAQERVEIETAMLPSGIIIVTASDEDGNSKTLSLLL